MQKEIPSTHKIEKRRLFETIRSAIPLQRRKDAAIALADHFDDKTPLLTFYSFGTEIDLSLLNQRLAKEKRLFLPKIEDGGIVPYRVHRLEDTQNSSHYRLREPNPILCSKAKLSEIQVILVPGLAFDTQHYRLGYGKGYYDRFLAKLKIRTIGVGFKEQLSTELLPRDPWDIPVDELALF